MTQDSLTAMWISDPPPSRAAVIAAVNAALHEDRAARDKGRWMQLAGGFAVALFCPVLLWCAAHGITPLVRGGYALMAAGTAILVSTGWMYATWSRQALPGPSDARSQLQQSAFLLARQATLIRTAPLWCAPVFLGTALIGTWIYQQRSASEGYLLWALIAVGWLIVSVSGVSTGKRLDEQRVRMERLLNDLSSI